jgi:hypothetical protein
MASELITVRGRRFRERGPFLASYRGLAAHDDRQRWYGRPGKIRNGMTRLFRARAILAVLCLRPLCRLGARAEVMDWSRRTRQILPMGKRLRLLGCGGRARQRALHLVMQM